MVVAVNCTSDTDEGCRGGMVWSLARLVVWSGGRQGMAVGHSVVVVLEQGWALMGGAEMWCSRGLHGEVWAGGASAGDAGQGSGHWWHGQWEIDLGEALVLVVLS